MTLESKFPTKICRSEENKKSELEVALLSAREKNTSQSSMNILTVVLVGSSSLGVPCEVWYEAAISTQLGKEGGKLFRERSQATVKSSVD